MRVRPPCFAVLLLFLCNIPGMWAEEPKVVEHTIYIPYQEFWKVFEQDNRGVFLPYEDYQKLMKAAEAAAEKHTPSPMEGVLLKEVSGTLTAEPSVIRGEVTFKLEVFSEGWHEIPLQVREWTVTSATLNGKPARLKKKSGNYVLLLEQKAEASPDHVLSLQFAMPYRKESKSAGEAGSQEHAVFFSLPEVAVSRWKLTVPGQQVEVNVPDSVAITRLSSDQGTAVELFLGGHKQLDVRWLPEVEGAINLDAVVQAAVTQQIDLEPDRVRTQSVVALEIDRSTIEQVVISVAGTERVVEVVSPRLKSWSAVQEGNRQQITVLFQEPVKGNESIRVESERYERAENWQAPVLEVGGAARQEGRITVRLHPELKSVKETVEGMSRRPVSANRKGGPVPAGKHMAWEYRTLPASLGMELEAVQPELHLQTLTSVNISPREVRYAVQSRVEVKRAGIFQIRFSIPEAFEIRNPRLEGRPHALERHKVSEAVDGRKEVTLDFGRRIQGTVKLAFELERDVESEVLTRPTGDSVLVDLPMVRGVGDWVVQDQGQLLVGSPAFLSLNLEEQSGLKEEPWQELTEAQAVKNSEVAQFGFRYTESPVSLRVRAVRKEPYTTVTQMLTVQASSGVIQYRSDLHVNVQYSGIQGIRVDVPTALEDQIRILNNEIRKEVIPDAPELKEGMTAWRLEGASEFTGSLTIPLQWETPLEGLDVGVRKEVEIPTLIPHGVDRSRGQIIFRKMEAMDILAGNIGPELTPVDPRHDLFLGRSVPDAAMAFEYQRDWDLTVTLVRYEPVNVKDTSIERGWVRQVMTRGGEVSVQALYQIRSVRQRLELKLPEEAEFTAQPLRLNGRSVSLERGQEGQVYLPLTGFQAEQALILEIRYTLPSSGPELTLPHFAEAPATQKVYLSVYVPENQVYLGHRGGWNPDYIWKVAKGYRLMPSGSQSEQTLWQWVKGQVSVSSSPLDRLSTDGQHVLFTTLDPVTDGVSIRISRFSFILFRVLTIGAGVLLGLLVLRASVKLRILVSMALVTALALMGVFLPSMARAIVNDATAAAVLLVLLAWLVYDILVKLPKVRIQTQRPSDPPPAPVPPQPTPEPPEPQEPSTPSDDEQEETDA